MADFDATLNMLRHFAGPPEAFKILQQQLYSSYGIVPAAKEASFVPWQFLNPSGSVPPNPRRSSYHGADRILLIPRKVQLWHLYNNMQGYGGVSWSFTRR